MRVHVVDHPLVAHKLTVLRDQLSAQRRALPWVRVEEPYVFDGPDGHVTFADLFQGQSQLVVYHFMFGADWEAGCKSCSFWADTFNAIPIHLKHRDVALAAISRAPIERLVAYKKRLGWTFDWVSSGGNDFNRTYGVAFDTDEVENGGATYNYGPMKPPTTELPGVSVFAKDGDAIFHTYSAYARGIDALNATYQFLDLVPKGRDEDGLPSPMAWVRRHDEYAD